MDPIAGEVYTGVAYEFEQTCIREYTTTTW